YFVPNVYSRMQSNGNRPQPQFYKYDFNLFAYPENFVNPVDVVHATVNQVVNFRQHGFDIAFSKFVSKQCFITESAGPGTATGKLQFCAASRAGKYVMTMAVSFDVIVIKVESFQRF